MLKQKSEQFLLSFFCALVVAPYSYANFDLEEFDLDTFSIELPVNQEEEQRVHAIDTNLSKACTIDPLIPFNVVELLTSLELPNILQNFTFYKFTQPPVVRELHDIPTLMPFQYHCAPSWAFSANGFFNQTRKVFFTQNSPLLGSYLNLTTPDDILDILEKFELPDLQAQIPDVLNIFGNNLTLEERRFGVMLEMWKHYKRWLFTAALPVYYVEHNFFLSEQKQQDLLNHPLFIGGAGFPGLNSDTFTTQHLIRDRAGIGDLRLQVLYNCAQQEKIDLRGQQIQVGGQITFPTAKSAITGINGGTSCFRKPPLINYLDMVNFIFCFKQEGDKQSLLNLIELNLGYAIDVLDQLTDTLCDSSLGQDHFNLGPVVHIQQPIWCHNNFDSSFELYGEMKYSIPAHENRFFKINTPPAADFNRDYTSEADAQSNLTFLEQQTTNILFPALLKITTKPGLMFHTNASFNGFWNEWEAGIGYDFWAQLKEHLGHFKPCFVSDNQFNFAAGRKQTAYEGKIFGQAGMRLCGDTFAMRFLARADATVHHKGIGSSFTVGLNFIIDF